MNFINLPFYETIEDGLQVNFLTHDRPNIFIGDGGKNVKEETKSVGNCTSWCFGISSHKSKTFFIFDEINFPFLYRLTVDFKSE